MKRTRLLQIISLMLVLLFAFTSCGDTNPQGSMCDNHVDATGDGRCDICNEEMSRQPCTEHADADRDGVCDNCGEEVGSSTTPAIDYTALITLPEYRGEHYTILNGNMPTFTIDNMATASYEYYGELDSLGRCTIAVACIGSDLLPTEARGDIGSVTPTGWVQASYDTSIVHNGYIWNRSHLIAWSLTGENANPRNLITATPYLNQLGMRQFEDMILDYIKETGNHVLFRVVPVFEGDNLVATGLHMEAYSIEDDGGFSTSDNSDGICFNVFMHNVNPGIVIDYATGETHLQGDGESVYDDIVNNNPYGVEYVLNISSKRIHLPTCSTISKMAESNKGYSTRTIAELMEEGYTVCGTCKPHLQTEPLSQTSLSLVTAYIDKKQSRLALFFIFQSGIELRYDRAECLL